jgi:hypothetical protein
MMRISVGVKSRPSMQAGNFACPPNIQSTSCATRVDSSTISPMPRSGLTCTRFRLAGSTRLRTNSEYLSTHTGPAVTSMFLRAKSDSALRSRRANWSLTRSSVGMRPRTILSCLPMS